MTTIMNTMTINEAVEQIAALIQEGVKPGKAVDTVYEDSGLDLHISKSDLLDEFENTFQMYPIEYKQFLQNEEDQITKNFEDHDEDLETNVEEQDTEEPDYEEVDAEELAEAEAELDIEDLSELLGSDDLLLDEAILVEED